MFFKTNTIRIKNYCTKKNKFYISYKGYKKHCNNGLTINRIPITYWISGKGMNISKGKIRHFLWLYLFMTTTLLCTHLICYSRNLIKDFYNKHIKFLNFWQLQKVIYNVVTDRPFSIVEFEGGLFTFLNR